MPARAADPLPNPPAGWPSDRLELGLADAPGRGRRAPRLGAVRVPLPVPRRRREHGQRLVDLEHERPVRDAGTSQDSAAHGVTPVFPYYMLLQSNPATGGSETGEGPLQPREPLDDGRLVRRPAAVLPAGRRRHDGRPPRRARPVGLHRAGERHGRRRDDDPGVGRELGRRRPWPTCRTRRPGSPGRSSACATSSRPNVLLAYHLSVWGTNWDISYSNSPDSQVDALAARAAAFYAVARRRLRPDLHRHRRSRRRLQEGRLRRRRRVVVGRRRLRPLRAVHQGVRRRRPATASSSGRSRSATRRCAPMDDTWGHYQDNRVEWFLDDPGRHAPRALARRRRHRAPVRRRRRRDDLRLRRDGRRRHEPARDQRQHAGRRCRPTTTAATSASGRPRTTPRAGSTSGAGVDPPPYVPPPPSPTPLDLVAQRVGHADEPDAQAHGDDHGQGQGVEARPRPWSTSASTTRRASGSSARPTTRGRSRPA